MRDMVFDPPLELQAVFWVRDGDTAKTQNRTVTIRSMRELEELNASAVPEITPEVLARAKEGFWRWAVPLPVQLSLHCLEVTGHLVPRGDDRGKEDEAERAAAGGSAAADDPPDAQG